MKNLNKKFLASTVATLIAFGSTPAVSLAFSDSANHWAKDEIESMETLGYIKGYEDGTFRPENKITREEASAIVSRYLGDVSAENKSSALTDIVNRWSENDIKKLVNLNILNGYSDNTFRPENNITRGEFAKIVAQTLKDDLVATETVDFTDIDNHWAKGYIKKLAKIDLIDGYPDKTFRPDNTITRAEVAKIIDELVEYTTKNSEVKNVNGTVNNSSSNNSSNNSNNTPSNNNSSNNTPSNSHEDEVIKGQLAVGYKAVEDLETPGVAKYGDIARITLAENELLKVDEDPKNAEVTDNDFIDLLPLEIHRDKNATFIYKKFDSPIEQSQISDALSDNPEFEELTDYEINFTILSNPEIERIKPLDYHNTGNIVLSTQKYSRDMFPQTFEEFNKAIEKYGVLEPFLNGDPSNGRRDAGISKGGSLGEGTEILFDFADPVQTFGLNELISRQTGLEKDREIRWVRGDGKLFETRDGMPMKVKIEMKKKSTGDVKIYYVTFRINKTLD